MNARTDAPTLGLIPDMPPEVYHSIPALSAGGLKELRRSPFHFRNRRPLTPRASLQNGTLTHCLLLEPAEFDKRFAVVPESAPTRPSIRQRNAAKPSPATVEAIAWWDAFHAEIAGREIVEPDALAAAKAQAAAVRSVPDVAHLLGAGYPEASAFWIDDETGELCKIRPDWVHPVDDASVILVDGKTCQDASPAGFARTVWNFRYDLQAAWYSDGWQRATGQRVVGFVFGAVESTWPHAAAAYMLDDEVLGAARVECRRLLDLYAECKATGVWPGYATEIQSITLPRWAMKEIQA